MEYQFHQWLRTTQTFAQPEHVVLGIGDDAGVLDWDSSKLVVTTDTIAEGTHFLLDEISQSQLERIGRKLIAVNFSDLAAMGATPCAVTLNFQVPDSLLADHVKHLFTGCRNICDQFNSVIIGGDTNVWKDRLVLSATAIGKLPADQVGWTLNGAQVGDSILVSGSFGGSIHGRHFDFVPRLELASYLRQRYQIHSATDASDSLTLDLTAIARASQVQFQIDLGQVPISPDLEQYDPALQGESDAVRQQRLSHALSDGEDFELLLTAEPTVARKIVEDLDCPAPLTIIGTVIAGQPGLIDMDENPVPVDGYIH